MQYSNQLMENHACGAGTTFPSEAPVFTDSDYPFVLLNIVFFLLFWPLYCQSFSDLRLLITPLVYSNFFSNYHDVTVVR